MDQAKASTPEFKVSSEAKFQAQDLELAAEFASAHERFDDTFINSLQSQFDEKGYLTEKQYSSLRSTMDAWDMDEWKRREG